MTDLAVVGEAFDSTESVGERVKEFAYEFATYLEDVKRRMLLIVGFFVAAFAAGFFASPVIIRALVDELSFKDVAYAVTSPFDVLSISVDIGIFFAITAAFPLILVEIYEFVRPALTQAEERLVMRYTLASVVLFIFGFAYGVGIMYYASLVVAAVNGTLGLVNLWSLQSLMSLVLVTSALLGLLFQLPLIMSALIEFGVISREFFARRRRLVIAATVIIVALLPPTDGLSLIVMALPIIGLYEFTLAFSRAPKGKHVLLDAVRG